MAGQNQGGGGLNMDQFEAYFRRADLDQDGKISGAEAVSFFQGSNLPTQVLAQIWMHADQGHTGYLSRQEFYNALKLVTVAQTKRELTPDIVKAALYGPASAKIPAPQINLAATSAPKLNSVGASPTPPIGGVPPTASQAQSIGFRGQLPPNTGMNPQYLPPQGIQSMRPSLSTSTTTASRPPHGVPSPSFPKGGSSLGPSLQNSSNDWLGGGTVGASIGPTAQVLNRPASPSMLAVSSKLQDPISTSSLTTTNDPKALPGPGNEFTSDSIFGGDTFSASHNVPKQPSLEPTFSAISTSVSSAIVPKTSMPESSAKPDPFAALQSTYTMSSTGSLPQQTHSVAKPNHQNSSQVSPSFSSSGVGVGGGNSSSEQSQPWPKMTRPGIQKYAKVFMEVDSDRDGKITGEQARNLFLSWRLPREVLKQIWDLSDQDNDSMLSLREFCIALYIMERYREGRTLPSQLPASIMLDETLLSLAGPPTAYGSTGWGHNPGLRPQQGLSGSQPIMHAGVRPAMQAMSQADGRSMQFSQHARGPLVENSHVNQLSNGLNPSDKKDQEAAETENKVENKEKVLLDSKEKLEYYRTKMQDLVLYKSRCDNRLNEITERALADKREAEFLGKKYEEKYKQVTEIASKLTIEEASFRDIQERKMELHQAITKMEQGGSADGILQVRADRIQSDLEELLKVITERCKKHGVIVKSTAMIELPPGWQPGIPEVAAVWDEEWDKFEDEGFSFDVAVPANTKLTSQHENSSPTDTLSPDSLSNADKSEKTFTKGVGAFETESLYSHSEDESKSPHGSPTRQTASESPAQDYSDNHFRKSFEADTESHSGFDESAWGTFDNNDDVDSVWGFGAKNSNHENHAEKYFFGSSDFGGSPTMSQPQADGAFQKNSPFRFEDSVPGTPLSRAGNSPEGSNAGAGDHFFDSFSRYDSFSTQDHGSPRRETLTRFDSINSTTSYDHSRGFSFDDSDPFGSSGPFKVSSSDSQTHRKGSANWSAF
ncbi:hypothetical protein ACH5RR_035346 [Cinchona calisaya]|uniref:Uncharacterized protein n=1 Tax=Cinchona calisaya TaxID=153742 RepID=A0ABD2YDU5_9GENT